MPKRSNNDFEALPLLAHAILSDIPLHDAWTIDLPRWRCGITLDEFLKMSRSRNIKGSASVRFLFWLRKAIGRVLGWDPQSTKAPESTLSSRVPPNILAQSLIEPGSWEGPFRVVYSLPNEYLAELRNNLLHGAVSIVLVEEATLYRLYLGVFVHHLRWFTPLYMAGIDPFRRWIVYPSILGSLRRSWNDSFSLSKSD